MNFSKVKLVICLCLIVVNIVFGVMCVRLVAEKNYISEEEVILAERHLAKNGVTVSLELDERRLYKLPIYAVENAKERERIPEIYQRITEAFFDVDVAAEEFIKTPEGYSVSVKNEKGILLGTASSTGTRLECRANDSVTAADMIEIARSPYLHPLTHVQNDSVKMAQKFVSEAFKGYGMRYQYDGARDYGSGKIVCFSAILSDTEILNNYLNVYVKKNKILCCVGNVTERVPQKKYSCDLIDSIDLMYIIPEYVSEKYNKTAIDGIDIKDFGMRYKMYDYGSGMYYLIPTWVIRYSDSVEKNEIITVDAVTGENIGKLK